MSRKNNFFKQVPVQNPKRSLFDLSHEVKMSGKFGYLYPVLVLDTLPGDVVREDMVAMVRFAPLLAPIMHRVDVYTHFFFVPNRLLTDGWEQFITGGQDGTETFVLPYVTPAGVKALDATCAALKKGTLWDYLGLPVAAAAPGDGGSTQKISLLPFKAYYKIYNDYYRDPNMETEVDLETEVAGSGAAWLVSGGSESYRTANYQLKNRAWEKDYYTACLPWAQRGAAVLMPLAGTGTVTYTERSSIFVEDGSDPDVGTIRTDGMAQIQGGGASNDYLRIENIDGVDLDTSTVYINDFRRALAIQRWLENNARGGGRYIEQIQGHFNQRVPDFRLQRAEYLGGGKQAVQISEVLATAEGDNVDVGDMKGHGLSVGKTNRFSYRCAEHGWVIGILSVLPKTAYQQGIDKMWLREDKYEFGWPELANLGEQEVLSKEVFFGFAASDDTADKNNDVFGYIPRYSEYKFKQDRVAGDFRTTLDFWGLTRIFTSRPVLDPRFTTMFENNTDEEDTYRRIFAVQDGTDYLWMQLFHKLTALRPLPYFGVPSII